MKQGILLVVFGSGSRQGKESFQLVSQTVAQRFPGIPVRWAFTSHAMRENLAKSQDTKSDSVFKALHKMYFEKYTHIAVQPLHLLDGREYQAVAAELAQAGAQAQGQKVCLGQPLLSCIGDVPGVAKALLQSMPPQRQPGEQVLCVGHGSRHSAENYYELLAHAVAQQDAGVHIACMKGSPSLESLEALLAPHREHALWLLPLLSMVGGHALNDIAGTKSGSWQTILQEKGFKCSVHMLGLAQSGAFIHLWLDRLQEAIKALALCPK